MRRPFPVLVAFELRHQLRHPVLWSLALALLAIRIVATWQQLPDWPNAVVDAADSAIIIGAGALLAMSLAASRDARPAAAGIFEALPVGAAVRTLALVVAGFTAAVVVTAVVIALQIGSMLIGSTSPAGVDYAELGAGLLLAGCMAVLGVAVARWAPRPVFAVVAVFVVLWFRLQFPGSWLLPVVPSESLVAAMPRPPVWHLLYVAALAAVLAGVAMLRAGRTAARLSATAAAVAVAVAAATLTLTSPEARSPEATIDPRKSMASATAGADRCANSEGIDYCAFPRFADWIPLWQAAVDPVAAAVPAAVRPSLPGVLQRVPVGVVDTAQAATNVLVGTEWGRNGGEVASRRFLAAQMAAAATGLPRADVRASSPLGCDGRGQARLVIALWLVGQVEDPQPAGQIERTVRGSDGREQSRTTPESDFGTVDYGDAELTMARGLLRDPAATARIGEHWSALVDPGTDLAEAAALLGLAQAPQAEPVKGQPC